MIGMSFKLYLLSSWYRMVLIRFSCILFNRWRCFFLLLNLMLIMKIIRTFFHASIAWNHRRCYVWKNLIMSKNIDTTSACVTLMYKTLVEVLHCIHLFVCLFIYFDSSSDIQILNSISRNHSNINATKYLLWKTTFIQFLCKQLIRGPL